MQNLEILPQLLPDIRAGRTLYTIRWRERVIVPGPMLYVNMRDASDMMVVWVTHVEKMRLSAVAARFGKSAGWQDTELLLWMRVNYPGIAMDSEVEIVHHLPPEP